MIDRRKLLSIAIPGISSVVLSACSSEKKKKTVEYYKIDDFGIIDSTGAWVIAPIFRQISLPVKGLCTASISQGNNSRIGLVDISGEWVIEPTWTGTGGLSELDYFGAEDAKSGLWGIARKDGSWQVEPYLRRQKDVTTIGTFDPELQIASAYDTESGRYGFIDGSGTWVVKPFATRISPISTDGLYAATKKGSSLYGLVDTEGNWIVEPQFKLIGTFGKTGYAEAISAKTELAGLIDRQGNWVVEPKFSHISTPNKSDFIPAEEYREGKPSKNLLWGFIDLSGSWVIEPKYLDARIYAAQYDVVAVCPEGGGYLYRLMNSKEEFVSEAYFTYISLGFSDEGYCNARPHNLEKPSHDA